MLPLALLFVTLAEVLVFVLLARRIGFPVAVLLVLVASLLGVLLLRREGLRAWRRFRAAARSGQPPGEQVTDGLVGLTGALLLTAPGLVTGVLGLAVLTPPGRRLAAGGVRRTAERRVSSSVAGDLFGPRRVRVRVDRQPPPSPAAAAGSPPPPSSPPQPSSPSQPSPPPAGASGGQGVIEGEIVPPNR